MDSVSALTLLDNADRGPGMDRERFADLLERVAQHQDRDAFAELFSFFAPRVKGYVMRLGATDASAEEIAQDVMITVWRKAKLFDRAQGSASTWIFRIARNRRIDVFRRNARPDLDPHDPALLPEEPIAADESLTSGERDARVRKALAELPDEQLNLLQAAYYEGLSHREIAQRAGLPLGTVKSRIRLAFSKLRARLASDD